MKIITFIQATDGKINSNSIEAFAASQKISEKNNAEIYLLIFDETLADQLASYKSNGVIIINNSELKNYNPIYYLSALESICNKYTPDLLFFGHTYETRDWVPRLSARLDLPFISDSTNFSFDTNYQSSNLFDSLSSSYYSLSVQDGMSCMILQDSILVDLDSRIVLDVDSSLETCRLNDGWISVVVQNGYGGYQYSIDSSLSFSSTIIIFPKLIIPTRSAIDSASSM